MERNKVQTFIMTQNVLGQKIYTPQNDPSKSYILSDNGCMVPYEPPENMAPSELDNEPDTLDSDQQFQNAETPMFAILGPLASDFDDNLMLDLDPDLMDAKNAPNQGLNINMDIQKPLHKLRELLELRLGLNLNGYTFYLQGTELSDPDKNLVELCIQGRGVVQISVQVLANLKRINILDVLQPSEDFSDTHEIDETLEEKKEMTPPVQIKPVVQWQIDLNYRKEQERLKIPQDPMEWTHMHVRHWLQWAVRQFNLPKIKLLDWSMSGKELFELTLADFKRIVPSDPGDVFWTHLEILRGMKVVAIKREDDDPQADVSSSPSASASEPKLMRQSKVNRVLPNYTTASSYFDTMSPSSSRAGQNGQIQLWQFLLELLTNTEYKHLIHWTRRDGVFKLADPQAVAQLWGIRKKKPAMNYEKLSRALRYYYDGDMISKVQGERFVYKFVCDLKELLGYDSRELYNLMKYGNARFEPEDSDGGDF